MTAAKPKILVIEDDDTTAFEIVRELKGRGFAVDRATGALDGLRFASSGLYDVITLDRMLPGAYGLTVASSLKDRGIETPILMISAIRWRTSRSSPRPESAWRGGAFLRRRRFASMGAVMTSPGGTQSRRSVRWPSARPGAKS